MSSRSLERDDLAFVQTMTEKLVFHFLGAATYNFMLWILINGCDRYILGIHRRSLPDTGVIVVVCSSGIAE
jgi:hypothetical protein